MAAPRKTPEINGGSMADISFLMLIFFLMVSTMDKEEGIARRLPVMPPEDMKVEDQKVNRRNIIQVKVNAQDRLFAGNEILDITQLKNKIKEFMTNPQNDPNLPDKEMTFIEGYGDCLVSKGVISLQNDRGTSYSKYIEVQNELIRAINELRDEWSMANYGRRYSRLTEEQQNIVRKAVPQNISEAEPKDVTKRRR
ncbi:MAG: biopolymer transporter ExbD [Bacteroidales bacterium]|jgi:biopolymer transport protein ExbD|nr:biopolymer transporter ExbD [Bacteroidales bacterium]